MGKAASSLGRRATRPIKEFNLEDRVAKELTKEKRKAAPRHQSTAAIIEESIKDQPKEVKQKLEQKDDDLLERLKSVYVTSEDVTPQHTATKNHPERPLPTDRTVLEKSVFGYHEPSSVPYGKLTLRDAVEAITRHQEDPKLWTAQKIAHEYRLRPELTEKMLRYFHMFVLVVPPDPKAKKTAQILQQSSITAPHTVRQLTAKEVEDDDKKDDKKS